MPNNEIILLKHAKTKIDSKTPTSNWKLDSEGFPKLQDLINNTDFSKLDIIIASTEFKAKKTAGFFSQQFNLEITSFDDLRELNRDHGKFDTNEGYNNSVKNTMRNAHQSFNNWETADSALTRFSNRINLINENYNEKRILIVSHGIVINLYLASIRKSQKNVFDFWMNMNFCDYVIIRNSTIIKDIMVSK